ncbi:MAG: CopG family transcriptional regulator [Egibacteraceae bacterium]
MRTTVVLADDVAAAVERLRRKEGLGLSEAVNHLARQGLQRPCERKPFVQKTSPLGARVDLTNIGEVLELLEGPDYR